MDERTHDLLVLYGPKIVFGSANAVREHDLWLVVASRSLRVLNPWAILANANSQCLP